jgi:hypothetical protein
VGGLLLTSRSGEWEWTMGKSNYQGETMGMLAVDLDLSLQLISLRMCAASPYMSQYEPAHWTLRLGAC